MERVKDVVKLSNNNGQASFGRPVLFQKMVLINQTKFQSCFFDQLNRMECNKYNILQYFNQFQGRHMQVRYMNFYTFDQFEKQSSNSDSGKFDEDPQKKNYLHNIKFEDIETVYMLTSRRTEGNLINQTIPLNSTASTEPKTVVWKTQQLKGYLKQEKKIQKPMYNKLVTNQKRNKSFSFQQNECKGQQ